MSGQTKPSLLLLGIIAAITAVVVLVVGFVVTALGAFEMPLSIALNNLHQGVLGALGDALYRWVGPVPAIIGTVVVTVIVLLVRRDLRVTSTFAITIAITWLSVAVVKLAVDRPRPDVSMLPNVYQPIQVDASYPSGHAAFIAALVFALVALFETRRARAIAGTIGAIVVAFAGFLLAVDGVHYVTDVLASIVWVAGVAPFVRAAWLQLVVARVPLLQRQLSFGRSSNS
ncbi:phosphatase PAP2 family protein [Microbacterium sp. X-17]|uniref:phosphatase PAP2 family protein n=1 Tax=Microbacterium sp. X-17 TaxID=3144404 RepID=UPI0031F5B864